MRPAIRSPERWSGPRTATRWAAARQTGPGRGGSRRGERSPSSGPQAGPSGARREEGPEDVTLAVRPVLRGRVRDDAGGISGAFVRRLQHRRNGPRNDYEWPIEPGSTRSDRFGDYALGLALGHMNLESLAPGYLRSSITAREFDVAEPGPVVRLEVGYPVSGRVVDERLEGLAESRLQLIRLANRHSRRGGSDRS